MQSVSFDSSFEICTVDDDEYSSIEGEKQGRPSSARGQLFWESRLYHKSYFTRETDNNKFKYYDSSNIFIFLLFQWVRKWCRFVSLDYVKPYKLHPLPVKDQILYWQPIFSKRVSDGIVRLETRKSKKKGTKSKPYTSILLRALFLTFFKRTFFGLFGIVAVNVFSMSIAIVVNIYLKRLHEKKFDFTKCALFVLAITSMQFVDGFCFDHLLFYMYRLVHIVHYCVSITVFQHGLCYRRKFFNNVKGSNVLNVCNSVLHSCSPESKCSENPLYCPARRFQNSDITPRMFSFEFIDSYYISLFFDSLISVIQFLTNCIYGFLLIKFYISLRIFLLTMAVVLFIASTLLLEVINTFILNYIYSFKDYRITQCRDIICSFFIIVKMSMESIAHNIITETRNAELSLIVLRLLLSFANKIFFTLSVSMMFLFILNDFVDDLKKTNDITKIKCVDLLTMLYILLKIIFSISLFPYGVKQMFTSIVSLKRIGEFIVNCSPNFYISDNKFTGSTEMANDVVNSTGQLDKDVVVLYKNASFTWVNSRKDLQNLKFQPYLKNINFQLKRGEIAIITGPQGCGKSNFIRSVLGEMTLIDGSMAVVPLHTSMPIFFASQEIWLQQGTIRSNITFGHRFDEVLYKSVLKAVELETDISSWDRGDLRVVSNYAFCLSGGQRVRIEMARAIYAYLVFSKVNKEYTRNQCSFLMCLDSPFHGLDPYVSRTVFNNLLNLKSGLLVKDDLSLIITSSLLEIEKCIKTSELNKFPKIPIYHIYNMTMTLYHDLKDYSEMVKDEFGSSSSHLDATPRTPADYESDSTLFSFTHLIEKASADINESEIRHNLTINNYNRTESTICSTSNSGFKPYGIYFSAAGAFFIFFLSLTFAATIMDNLKFIFASELADYIRERVEFKGTPHEMMNRFADIQSHSDKSLKAISLFTVCVIGVCSAGTIFLVISCVKSSRKIHEYCINSIFTNSSAVVKIKRKISQLITYLSSDIFQIDESIGYAMSTALVSLVESLIHVLTLCYLIPFSTPVIVVVVFVIIKFVFIRYVNASKNLQLSSLESTAHINSVCENAISGSEAHRCFKKEWKFMDDIIEHTDYYMRCLFLNKSVLTRSSIIAKGLFSLINLVLLIPLIRFKFHEVKIQVGIYGLAISLSMIVSYAFTNFMVSFGRLEVLMCSMKRFESFVPLNTKCRFEKKRNVRKEDFIVNYSKDSLNSMITNEFKYYLYKRRVNEYKKKNSCFSLNTVLNPPKLVILDIATVLPITHTGLEIKKMYVDASESNSRVPNHILKDINASASASDIIGIIGRTGSGKTTLLSVIQNTVGNRTGQVLLDGKDLNDIPRHILGQIIGVLPQLPFVFKGWTIRRFLDPRKLFTDDEINQALDSCGLLEFVNRLPGNLKLDTVIIKESFTITKRTVINKEPEVAKKRASAYRRSLTVHDLKNYYADSDMILSSSQLRTLSFARLVLYKKFYRIILVDEPPSENCSDSDGQEQSLDKEIGIPIYELLKDHFCHCTTFVTAHDANALVLCTSVWVMHNGYLIRICDREDISLNESISNIIEESVRRKSLNK
ncbi:ABC transporter family protein [Theileria parva strain Muguga]|uniref:ABC transporter, putative n=1 Tax=Theileria parva TaxID=5875 RepID=Q4N599_THEPA|nr:ABC transporter family protein [Theileria parva strain Muguga]EAN32674.1 ABC transporter family protein [Theileria parva strain Muguga]|eukprot:XP_764957.1 ABC transporter [Theileria parva strain Muguga]